MVLGKPFSHVTGSVITNVPLHANMVDDSDPWPNKWKNGVASKFARSERAEDNGGGGGGGGGVHRGELW